VQSEGRQVETDNQRQGFHLIFVLSWQQKQTAANNFNRGFRECLLNFYNIVEESNRNVGE
jgi:hypothetical protein